MNCCICGTVKNCGSYLDKIFNNMEKIGTLFEEYVIIIYYDKSDDNTLQKLQQYQKLNNKLKFHVNKDKTSPYRTHNISKGRNYCLQEIRNHYKKYEYFMMMDCDDRCAYDINIRLLNEYLKRTDWDSLSFNHPAGYYDLWALSKRPFIFSCHHFNNANLWREYIDRLLAKCKKSDLISCFSAFNGCAIYRTPKFINCYYDGRYRNDYIPKNLLYENIKVAGNINNKQNKEDCEHRHFHFQAVLKNNARIRISPLCLFYSFCTISH